MWTTRGRKSSRGGATLVEFAIVAPIVFIVLLGLTQFASLMMNQNILTSAAREGARVASLPGTTTTDAVDAAVLAQAQRGGIDPDLVSVTVTPTPLASLAPGAKVSVFVSAPTSSMAWIWAVSPPDGALTAEITYERE